MTCTKSLWGVQQTGMQEKTHPSRNVRNSPKPNFKRNKAQDRAKENEYQRDGGGNPLLLGMDVSSWSCLGLPTLSLVSSKCNADSGLWDRTGQVFSLSTLIKSGHFIIPDASLKQELAICHPLGLCFITKRIQSQMEQES